VTGLKATGGAKKRDYPWTVLVVDPLAFPLVRLLGRRRWLTPDQVTYVSLVLGVAVGPLFALGNRAGLISGAILYYLSFVFDCVDGKLARLLGVNSPRGKELDAIADGARRASAVIGLGFYAWRTDEPATSLLWILAFGILSFYFMEISGAEKQPAESTVGSRWTQAMARRRLLPTPGMPDVSAIVFVIGPLVGAILPALYVGIVMVFLGILLTFRRRLRVTD